MTKEFIDKIKIEEKVKYTVAPRTKVNLTFQQFVHSIFSSSNKTKYFETVMGAPNIPFVEDKKKQLLKKEELPLNLKNVSSNEYDKIGIQLYNDMNSDQKTSNELIEQSLSTIPEILVKCFNSWNII
mmetsp:Transcript_5108/g.7680  ORF Transcript_5108/g.7680 Transcript_5108/m.7680 type:complete len:127 (-) Transcript_5108:214-594(-)